MYNAKASASSNQENGECLLVDWQEWTLAKPRHWIPSKNNWGRSTCVPDNRSALQDHSCLHLLWMQSRKGDLEVDPFSHSHLASLVYCCRNRGIHDVPYDRYDYRHREPSHQGGWIVVLANRYYSSIQFITLKQDRLIIDEWPFVKLNGLKLRQIWVFNHLNETNQRRKRKCFRRNTSFQCESIGVNEGEPIQKYVTPNDQSLYGLEIAEW